MAQLLTARALLPSPLLAPLLHGRLHPGHRSLTQAWGPALPSLLALRPHTLTPRGPRLGVAVPAPALAPAHQPPGALLPLWQALRLLTHSCSRH
jgi:hypothetical protein